MQYSACLNPQLVYNKYTHTYVQVPCRKCEACQLLSSRKYVDRLERERKLWQDSLFFTLTYNEIFLPRIVYTDNFVVNPYDNLSIAKRLNFAKIEDYYNDDEWFNEKVSSFSCFGVVCRRDIKEFLSRLKESYPFSSAFVSSEYGPTTFRPHYHGLVFFNKRGVSREYSVDELSMFISRLWSAKLRNLYSSSINGLEKSVSLGFVQVRYDSGSSARYTAQYLNCSTHFPQILRNHFPPFHISYGVKRHVEISDYSLHELLYSGDINTFGLENKRFGVFEFDKFDSLPYDILCQYFRRFRGSNRITSHELRSLLLYIDRYENFSDFVWWLNQFDSRNIFRSIFNSNRYDVTDSQLQSFYYALRSCLKVVDKFNLSLSHYCDIYVSVWSRYALNQLKNFYELQEQISVDPAIDTRWINGLYLLEGSSVSLPFPDAPFKFSRLSLANPLFARYSKLIKKIYLDTSKTKKRNDYLNKF